MRLRHCLTATIGLVAATPAFADAMEISGTGHGMSDSTVHIVSEGHMLVALNTTYSSFGFDDPDNPMNGMSGPCFGAMEMKGGTVSGGGLCHYTDAGGDVVSTRWVPERIGEDGAVIGVWSISGGTGPWAAASGGGSFSSLTDRETGDNTNTVTGSVTLP